MPATVNDSSYRLTALLHRLFQAQAADVARRVTLDDRSPDVGGWDRILADAVKPLYLQHFQSGMVASQRRIAALLAGRKPHLDQPRRVELHPEHTFDEHSKGVISVARDTSRKRKVYLPELRTTICTEPNPFLSGYSQVTRAGRGGTHGAFSSASFRPFCYRTKGIGASFDLFNPKVLDAVDAAVLTFCRETNDTAVGDLKAALAKLRRALKRGLKRGDALKVLAVKVRSIFADPYRAFRIAKTESSRATHEGGLLAAKDSGVVRKKEWLASSDACDLCMELDGKQVDLDEPFVVDGTGPYARVMVPPRHPH